MGNACCSEHGGNSNEDEMKNYESRGRPVNQSLDDKRNIDVDTFGQVDGEQLLLAYTSGDQKKIVKI